MLAFVFRGLHISPVPEKVQWNESNKKSGILKSFTVPLHPETPIVKTNKANSYVMDSVRDSYDSGISKPTG